MGYKVHLKTGRVITLAEAVREERDGSGVRFYTAEGVGCGSFGDGVVDYAYPDHSAVEEPTSTAEPAADKTATNTKETSK
ncbi:hypothetical protein [Falsirhodobacter halotolerans]|uniref:hypothetical protein n=1 Tax=Falsirhodobacter halotolerans TaxID=1146892 RepID=UPI001FD091AA|nr:hypothetical protein [Falsirhodobacter halotolerans]MCJ8138442.1 hypothetical protein [Falsirhodobacter halotolerans]